MSHQTFHRTLFPHINPIIHQLPGFFSFNPPKSIGHRANTKTAAVREHLGVYMVKPKILRLVEWYLGRLHRIPTGITTASWKSEPDAGLCGKGHCLLRPGFWTKMVNWNGNTWDGECGQGAKHYRIYPSTAIVREPKASKWPVKRHWRNRARKSGNKPFAIGPVYPNGKPAVAKLAVQKNDRPSKWVSEWYSYKVIHSST